MLHSVTLLAHEVFIKFIRMKQKIRLGFVQYAHKHSPEIPALKDIIQIYMKGKEII